MSAGAHLTAEIRRRAALAVVEGMAIAIPAADWEATFGTLSPKQLAAKLRWLARKVDLRPFQTNPWTPKKPQPKRIGNHPGNHVSTDELLLPRGKRSAKPRAKAKI